MKRNIAQIATCFDAGDGSYKPCVYVVALCHDGTIWEISRNGSSCKWERLPAIPDVFVKPRRREAP